MASAGRPRILVVDDHLELRELLADFLEHQGYLPEVAGNGHEALQALEAVGPVDLILLDLTMPVMDGWAFRAALLADARWASIPVVVLSAVTGLGPPKDVQCALVKPVDLDMLHDIVRRLVGNGGE